MKHKTTYKITKWHPNNDVFYVTVDLNHLGSIDGKVLFSVNNIDVDANSTKDDILNGYKLFLSKSRFVLNVEMISCEDFE